MIWRGFDRIKSACLSVAHSSTTNLPIIHVSMSACSLSLSLSLSPSLKHFFTKCKPPHEDRRECLSLPVSERERREREKRESIWIDSGKLNSSACESVTCPFCHGLSSKCSWKAPPTRPHPPPRPINRHLWRSRHIISYPRGTRMCLLNNYAQVLVLLFSETNPWLFSSGLVLLPWKFTLSLCRFGRYLGLEKFSYNANEWIPTQKNLSDIVEYALIMLWRVKEEQITNEPRHDKTDKMSVRPPSEDSDQPGHPPSLIRVFGVRMKNAWSLATHWVHCEDSGQTGWMPRLIWVFAGRTHILLVLSCRGSN